MWSEPANGTVHFPVDLQCVSEKTRGQSLSGCSEGEVGETVSTTGPKSTMSHRPFKPPRPLLVVTETVSRQVQTPKPSSQFARTLTDTVVRLLPVIDLSMFLHDCI